MSYSIILTHKDGALKEIPIARHVTFHKFWLPLFIKHGLENLANMQYGHDIDREELGLLISEYTLLMPYLSGEREIERTGFIIQELAAIDFNYYESITVG